MIRHAYLCLAAVSLVSVLSGCSTTETKTYDDLVSEGEIEALARRRYAGFFRAIGEICGGKSTGTGFPDSTAMKKVMSLTDEVIEDMRPFPATLRSRVSLDALSYAASDLTLSPAFEREEVGFFWRNALLDPMFTLGFEYLKADEPNESTLKQIVRALQRGIGTKGTDEMLIDMIKIVGPAPPEEVLELCRSDSLVFRKVYDLLIYSRSLQEYGPPLWMMTGPWFLVVLIEDWPAEFYCLKPLDLNGSLYLTFRDYTQGEVYAEVCNDPVPDDAAEMDAWLSRAAAAMDSLRIDDEFARRILKSRLPTYDAHMYYNDYLLAARADTVKSEYHIIIKRQRVEESPFQYAGHDSLVVVLTQREILSRAETITPLRASRHQGESMIGGRYIPPREGRGVAFLMPMGHHDESILEELQKSMLPKFTVQTR